MKGKRFLALVMSTVMVTGSSVTVFAADKSGKDEGTGELQYVATDDVFDVVLPTSAGTTFDYLLDPDGLIKETSGARYNGKTFEDDKTVYFLHTDNTKYGNKDYTDISDMITVTNKSTKAVDLTVTAKIAEATGVKMAASASMDGEGENLYMAIVGKNDTNAEETKAITTDGVTLTGTIAEDTNAYAVTWDATKGYVKALTDAAKASDYTGFKSYTFKLTGACKANDTALTALKENPPKIDLTWSVKDFMVTEPQVTLSASGLITISGLTEEANVGNGATDILVGYASDGDTTLYPVASGGVTWIIDSWDATNGGTLKVQLKAGTYNPFNGKSINVSVKLTDGSTITGNSTIGTVAE